MMRIAPYRKDPLRSTTNLLNDELKEWFRGNIFPRFGVS
jgi:hypothetical protein